MKQNYTHICIVLDASGSMAHLANETKSSFNGFIENQKGVQGFATTDVYQFNSKVKKIVDFKSLNDVTNLMSDYVCNGNTALNDAICTAIDEVGVKLSSMKEEERPEKVLFVVLTDGEENASSKFTAEDVKNKISHQTDVYHWDFLYLGANQDAFTSGTNYGFAQNRCSLFHSSAGGLDAVGTTLKSYVSMYRQVPVDQSNNLGIVSEIK